MPLTSPLALLRVDADSLAANTHPRHRHPALDLKYIQSAVRDRNGFLPPLIDHTLASGLSAEQLADRVLACRPRIAIVKAQSWNLDTAIRCARRLRAAGVVTIAVGQQVLHAARSPVTGWQDAYDIALPGDAEAEAPRLVTRLLSGEKPAALAASYTERMATGRLLEIDDPDSLPIPHFDTSELAAYPFPFPLRRRPVHHWGYVLTAWGCPRACRHCSVVVRKSATATLRARSIELVVDEVARLADQGAQGILFEDDSLCIDRRRFLGLCDALIRRRLTLPWIANARPDELDRERVAAAAASGAALFKVGVDCAAPRLIERIAKARDGLAWIAAAENAFGYLDEANIGSVALFMVGLPDEQATDVEASIKLARRLRPDYVQVQIYTPYPDTAIWAELSPAQRNGSGTYHYGIRSESPSRIAAADLPKMQGAFYRRFYLDSAYFARHLARSWRHYLTPQALLQSAAHVSFLLRKAVSDREAPAPAEPPNCQA
ncbi:MAG: radical SAM protein [Rhodocyclales bacterium RIFCSPLOWO2_02_FULL_63_24]|nr:MAG: radical SAM protein [Rhodocyclales bacterium RIFCSPLOWO2_02_FULL_63_24]